MFSFAGGGQLGGKKEVTLARGCNIDITNCILEVAKPQLCTVPGRLFVRFSAMGSYFGLMLDLMVSNSV